MVRRWWDVSALRTWWLLLERQRTLLDRHPAERNRTMCNKQTNKQTSADMAKMGGWLLVYCLALASFTSWWIWWWWGWWIIALSYRRSPWWPCVLVGQSRFTQRIQSLTTSPQKRKQKKQQGEITRTIICSSMECKQMSSDREDIDEVAEGEWDNPNPSYWDSIFISKGFFILPFLPCLLPSSQPFSSHLPPFHSLPHWNVPSILPYLTHFGRDMRTDSNEELRRERWRGSDGAESRPLISSAAHVETPWLCTKSSARAPKWPRNDDERREKKRVHEKKIK